MEEFTFEKFPSGFIWELTQNIFEYPALFNISGISICEVPCNAVKTIFKFFLSESPILAVFILSFTKLFSILLSSNSISFGLELKLISE